MRRKCVLTLIVVMSCCWAWLAVPLPAAGQVTCGQVIPYCVQCVSSGPYIVCGQCAHGFELSPDRTTCIPCSKITPNCATCSGTTCQSCNAGFELQNGACVACTAIDPKCTTCSGGKCTDCASGYEPNSGGTACVTCSTIDPNCTSCSGNKCTGCASGYGVSGGGASCVPCSQIQANCTQCSTGTCTSCTNGFAANLAGQCVQPGTSGCSFDVQGQCCQCQYDCQTWNSAGGSCVGAPMNGCGPCMSRQ